MYSLAIFAHNEEKFLPSLLEFYREVVGPKTPIIVVDSASTDRTPEIALEHKDVMLVKAPLGKGAAFKCLLRSGALYTPWLLCSDGDLDERSFPLLERVVKVADHFAKKRLPNPPQMLIIHGNTDNVVGYRTHTDGIVLPMLELLFPEIKQHLGMEPLTGMRILSGWRYLQLLPNTFGLEMALNLWYAEHGRVGSYEIKEAVLYNQMRPKLDMVYEVAYPIMAHALLLGKIDHREWGMINKALGRAREHIARAYALYGGPLFAAAIADARKEVVEALSRTGKARKRQRALAAAAGVAAGGAGSAAPGLHEHTAA